jgi:hypothetical protein
MSLKLCRSRVSVRERMYIKLMIRCVGTRLACIVPKYVMYALGRKWVRSEKTLATETRGDGSRREASDSGGSSRVVVLLVGRRWKRRRLANLIIYSESYCWICAGMWKEQLVAIPVEMAGSCPFMYKYVCVDADNLQGNRCVFQVRLDRLVSPL